MIDFSDFSSEVFQILRAYGKDIVLYDETGKRVFEPTEARRMYVIGDNILVSIVEDGDNSAVKLFLSPSLNLTQVQGFLETLRRLAIQSNLLFHVKKYNKEIKPKDFATQASVNEHKEIPMNIMEGLYGTSKSSYLKMENARMIVRHSARIKEHVIGDRGRHIHSIFVENAQGERFLFPVNMLSGARAMTQHVNKGGNFADEVGSQIVRMAQDFRNLAQVTNHINNLPGLQESIKENEKVEAHGVKGMKSTPWRKIFKNLDALNAWCEKNDAEVHAYSAVEKDTTHESALALRTAVMEAMRGTKRSFSRIYTESTYLGESERVASNTNLMEDSESLSESLAAISAILGEGLTDEALLSVARNVTIEDATAPQLDEEVDEVEEIDEEDEVEGDDEMEEGHQIDVTVEGAFTDTPNNPQIREFEQWLESFDPDTMFGQKNEAHDPVQAELDQIESQYSDPSEMPPEVAARWEELANTNVTNIKWGHDRIQQKTTESPAQWEVHGIIGLDSKFCKKFDSEESRQEWLDKHEHSGKFDVTKLVDPAHAMAEGKSYKRNKDEDADDKKAKDQERKDAAKSKKQPVEEGKSFKRNDDDEEDVKDKRKEDKQKRDEKKKPVEEGKSFKRNDDEDEADVKAKRKEDKQKRDEKKAPVEEGKSFKRNDDDEVDADTKKKEDKQKRDAKKQPVSEDASRFSGSFETNINDESGNVVSAKVTYVPNEAGAATILSVVRGDNGEDVLPFMDDDDILHVEGLCADDIAQQGSEQYEDTTIPRNPHQDFKDDVMTGGQGGEEQDPSEIARMKALAGLK